MSVQMNNERHSLMKKISALGLALYDTMLYLDIHDCPEARQYYEKRESEYRDAVCEYEEKYGIINLKGHPDEDVLWSWQIC